MQNLNYLLNKEYYGYKPYKGKPSFSHERFNECNKELINSKFKSDDDPIFSEPETYSFVLKTAYPGLLIGLGNTHEAGTNISGAEEEGAEIKLGFTLDYVTGLPIIPGSTVKGVLRSAFSRYGEYVGEILEKDKAAVNAINEKVFGKDETGICVFYDAVPVNPNKKGHLLGLDHITPHSDPLKNPIPLTMLKVIPGVSYLFRFSFIKDIPEDAENLIKDFKTIFMDLGIGSKTNVGFGVLVDDPEHPNAKTMLCQKES